MKNLTVYKIYTVVFLIFIFSFLGTLIFFEKEEFSDEENRALESFPEFSFDELISAQWTKDFETFLNDHSPFREFFVGARSQLVSAVGYKEVNGVYLGEDDYQMQKVEVDEAKIYQSLTYFNDFAKENQDKNVVVGVVPSASYILSDKMPQNAYISFDEEEFGEKASLLLEDKYIDFTSILKENGDGYIYYKTDHHLTTNGSYLIFSEVAKKLGIEDIGEYEVEEKNSEFLGTTYSKTLITPSEKDVILQYDMIGYSYDYTVNIPELGESYDSIYFEENLQEKDKYLYFTGYNRALIEIGTNHNTGREITIIKDSIANSFIPFLIPYYDKINIVDLRFFNGDLDELTHNSQDILILYYITGIEESSVIQKLER